MPLTMKVQPIDGTGAEQDSAPVKPVVKSRLKRLFRISVSEPTPIPVEVFEPSSVCLAKMVANFIEESNNNNNERHASRNRCNCFNGNGSDGSDGEADAVSASDVCDFLKSLVVCASVNERNVLADTARLVAEKNKVCKRKDELRKLVVEGLMAGGYDAAICKSKWEKSPSFPAGEYEYVDVVVEGERLIIDIDFRSEFEVARSTKTYKSILQTLPNIFVGKSDRLSKIICILSEAAKQSLKKKGMHIPPWRKADYVQAKWLSPPNRVVANSVTAIPTPNPMTTVGSLNISNGPSPNNPATPPPSLLTPVAPLSCFNGPSPNKSATPSLNPLSPVVSNGSSPNKSSPATTLAEGHQADETEASSVSPKSETVFDMSDGSEEEDTKAEVKLKKEQAAPKKSLKIIAGLASLMEHKP